MAAAGLLEQKGILAHLAVKRLTACLGDMAHSHGMAQVARKTGMTREAL